MILTGPLYRETDSLELIELSSINKVSIVYRFPPVVILNL